MEATHSNRLAKETSPYLLQHSNNPVDWYPWGNEAIERAKKEDRPILLSIGYSACHWCHVMEEECFDNESIAQLMNELFINIKVDREERPDLDRLYMSAVQVLTGTGGWPLTVFLTPELIPFFGGTYFPPEDRGGMPGFPRVLRSVAAAYRTRKDEITGSGHHLVSALRGFSTSSEDAGIGLEDVIKHACSTFLQQYDWEHGGFGGAPKFPQTSSIGFLLRMASGEHSGRALEMVQKALDGMAAGGIRDQLGGGFHRYSVDEKWLVPHFEKMLYDNANLARLYLDAHVVTGNGQYATCACETLEYVLRQMTSPEGGFYTSQDADSEGEEGTYYVWREKEILSLLGEQEGRIVARYYGVDHGGNFERGLNVLHRPISLVTLARLFKVDPEETDRIIKKGRKVLLGQRGKRVRPRRDEKIIAAWNGLMLGAMARGYQVLQDKRFLDAARKAGDFLLSELRNNDGLLHVWTMGEAKIPGFLDDYALVVEGLLDLWEADFDIRWLKSAKTMAYEMIQSFWDEKSQRFSSTGPRHEKLIADIPALQDEPFPSGNSGAVHLLLRLAAVTGERAYEEKAQQVLRGFSKTMQESPGALAHLLSAAQRFLSPVVEIVIAGGDDGQFAPHLAAARSVFVSNGVVVSMGPKATSELEELVPLVRGKSPVDGKTTAYVCVGQTCLDPVTDPRELEKALTSSSTRISI